MGAGFGAYLKSLNTTQLSNLIEGSTMIKPRYLALMPINGGIPIDPVKDLTCTVTFELLKKILEDKDIPFKEKKKAVGLFFRRFNFQKPGNRVLFTICIINLMFLLYHKKFDSFYLLLSKLRSLFLSGKLSRVLYYAILRGLQKRGIPVNSEIEQLYY
jgi:hypothetical protein